MSAFATVSPDLPKCTLVQQGEDPSLTQRQELPELVDQHADIYFTTPGLTHLLQHEFKTGVVVRQWPYCVPEAHCQAIEEQVSRMLQDGIIEDLSSPWSSLIVVVLKPNGSLRLCNDFWRLNTVSNFDSYPLP